MNLRCKSYSLIKHQAPVVQRLDKAIHRINRYPLDKYWQNKLHAIHWIEIYPVDRDINLSNNWGQLSSLLQHNSFFYKNSSLFIVRTTCQFGSRLWNIFKIYALYMFLLYCDFIDIIRKPVKQVNGKLVKLKDWHLLLSIFSCRFST